MSFSFDFDSQKVRLKPLAKSIYELTGRNEVIAIDSALLEIMELLGLTIVFILALIIYYSSSLNFKVLEHVQASNTAHFKK
jgi:hypothetical protein